MAEAELEVEPVEFPDWEFVHNNSNDPPLVDFPLINSHYFSLHPPPLTNSTSISQTDPSHVDRNFDDSYVANQLFPAPEETHLIKQPSTETTTTTAAASELVLDDDDDDDDSDSKKKKEEEENRRVGWWKVPFQVFKYWVSSVLPLSSLSLTAAAFLGIVILGRRLYKMKRKSQTFNLNVSLDDDHKKISQLMGRVARLNESFSVVRRVPIVQPSLPASSVTLRPVMMSMK